jgi:DNA-binding CsgD family transcriptional regulator
MVETAEKALYGFEMRAVDNRRSGRESCHDIKQLWQRSHEILGLALQGLKNTEIAKILNIHPQTVSNTLNSTLGKEKLSNLREGRDEHYKELSERVIELTHKSLDEYEKIFNTPNIDPELKKKTADTIVLEVAGMRAPTRIESKSFSMQATAEEIEEFKRRGIEAARESGKLVVLESKLLENKENNVDD